MRSLGALLAEAAASESDAIAFVEGERRLSYAEWDRAADRAAARLTSLGLRPGDVVALLLPWTAEYPIAYVGAARAGLVTAGINPRLGVTEIGHILETSTAKAIVTVDAAGDLAGLDVVESVRPGSLRHVISPGDLLDSRDHAPPFDSSPDHPVAIVYTSGTTGLPKGATYSAQALEAVRRIEHEIDPEPHPKGLGGTPLAHMGFMTKIGSHIDKRGTTVLMERWSARAALEIIEAERLTHIGGVPTQMALMMMDPAFERTDLSSLRSMLVGGAPASPDLVRQIRERFGLPVTVRYSCTELAMATGTRPGDPDEVVAETVGRPWPEIDVRIDGPDSIGEVCVRSPTMTSGYWRDPEATRAAIDEHGWFHTGDLGEIGGDGNLRLRGRSKEMYIRGGYNVYPVEVEAALREHPKVGLAAVMGVPDEVMGEKGLALVQPRDPADPPDPGDLKRFVAARIADYKVPDRIEIREPLPLNPMFKVDKRALSDELRSPK